MSSKCQNGVLIQMAVLLIATVVAIAGEPPAFAASETRTAPVAANVSPKISQEQATQAALKALPGKVTDVTVEKKRGKNVYVIEIVADKDGAETDVLVDMDSGAVLGMEQ
jgi:uncharacterized membrane protein YkoI